MRSVTMLGASDTILGWDGQNIYLNEDATTGSPAPDVLEGVAASVRVDSDGSLSVFRDRLGIGKLFWARDAQGDLRFASRPLHLIRAGHRLDDIMAVPRGMVMGFDESGKMVRKAVAAPLASGAEAGAPTLAEVGRRIRAKLDAYLAAIAAAYPQRRVFVCLSGGLDSSTIAVLAQRHFSNVTAVSFDLASGPSRAKSEDRVAAERLAKDLGIPMIESTVTSDELLSFLDTVLVEGIDWRDFNVHAALVNAALANTIAAACKGDAARPLVITGDLSNEFLVDYKQEEHKGITYYALPRIDAARLRNILIQGLETCHREVGIFEAWNLSVVQPYAVAVDDYLTLPPSFLREDTRKDLLVREIVGEALPDYIYSRPKVRAQTGGTDESGGVLGACVAAGVDAAALKRRFAQLHEVAEDEALDRFIRAGRYRAAVPVLGETAYEPA